MLDIAKEVNRLKPLDEAAFLNSTDGNVDSKIIQTVVSLYNQALIKLQTKSDDIAAIELKKALSIWPDFQEAKALLGLCYIMGNHSELAVEQLKGILDSDHYVARAQRYLNHIEMQGTNTAKSPVASSFEYKPGLKKDKAAPFQFKQSVRIHGFKVNLPRFLTFLLLGVLIILIAIYIVSFLSVRNGGQPKKTDDNTVPQDTYANTVSSSSGNQGADGVKEGIDAGAVPGTQQSPEVTPADTAKPDGIALLQAAENNINEGKLEEAVQTLVQLKDYQFDDENQNKYKSLFDKTIPKYTRDLYNKGKGYFNMGKFAEAADYLERSVTYSENANFADDAWYVAGKCYQETGNKEKAAECYNQVIARNPGGQYATWAKGRLNKLN